MDALGERGGAFGTARLFAAGLGFRDRHDLARALHRECMPPLEELAAWTRLISWVLRWEQDGTALCHLALEAGADPAAYYRTVRRLTGASWSHIRCRGVAWTLERLRDRCPQHATSARHTKRTGLPGSMTG